MDVEHIHELSVQQTEAIGQFMIITGIVNWARVRDILQRHDWQLEEAIYDQFNLKAGYPSIFSNESDVPDLKVKLNSDELQVFNAETTGNNSYLSFVIKYILKAFYNKVVSSVFSWRSIWPKRQPLIAEPVSDVIKFISYFESKYGDSHPAFYKGSYNQALNEAKREMLFLVVYLHKKNQSDCSNFCSLLTNNKIVSFMNEGNILFWACDLDTNEGNRVATTLKAHNEHPYVSVVLLINGIMTQLAQMKGFMSIQEFLNRLQTIIVANQSYILLARVKRIEKHYRTMLRDWNNLEVLEPMDSDKKFPMKRKISDEEEQDDEYLEEYLHNQILEVNRMIEKEELEVIQKLEEPIQNQKLEEEKMTQEEELEEKQELEKRIQNQKLEGEKMTQEKELEEKQELKEHIQNQKLKEEMVQEEELEEKQELVEHIQNQKLEEKMVQEKELNNKNSSLSVEIQNKPSSIEESYSSNIFFMPEGVRVEKQFADKS